MRIKSIISMIILLKIVIFGIITNCVQCEHSNVNNIESLDYSSRRRQFSRAVSSKNNEDPATLFEKLPAVARLVTAIAIINGFSDGSIPADPVIAEFFNVDTAILQQLEKFNKASVDKFVESLNSAAIDSNEDTLKVEQAMINIHEVKMAWKKIGSLSNIPAKSTLDPLSTIASWDLSVLKSFDLISTLHLIDSESPSVLDLKKKLETLTSAVKKLPTPKKMKPFIDLLKKWTPFDQFADIVGLHLGYSSILSYPLTNSKFDSNANAVNNITAVEKSSIILMKDVAVAPFSPANRSFTAGFANGFSDIEKLTSDSKDRWLHSLLEPSVPLSGVKTLTNFGSELRKLDDKWRPVTTENHYHTMKKMSALQNHLEKTMTSKKIKATVDRIKDNCGTGDAEDGLTRKIREGVDNAALLLKTLKAIEFISNTLTNNVVNDFKKLSSNSNSSEIQKIGTMLRSFTRSLKLIEDLQQHLQDRVKGALELKFFHDTKIPSLIAHFNCLKNRPDDTEKIASTVRSIRILRKLKADSSYINNFNEMSSVLSGSSQFIVSLRKTVEEYKKDNSSEVIILKKLNALKDLSKPFGDAIGALVSIKKASSGSELGTFVTNGEYTQEMVPRLGTAELKTQFEKYWGDFEATKQQVDMFRADARYWEKSISIEKNSKLSAYGQMFKDLADFKSIDLELENRLEATEGFNDNKLNPEITQLVAEFRDSLMKLSKLDLDFSRYKSALNIMPDVLKSVDGGFKGKRIALPVIGGGNVSTTTEFAIVVDTNSTLVCTVTVLIIGSILGIIAFLWCWRDQNCIYHKLRRRYAKPTYNMQTAREPEPNTPKPAASHSDPEPRDLWREENNLHSIP
ncbi:uncharacterized protein CELE_F36G9.13 [Caenorhabditis elegans]|uniref:Domain of unknown function WSN domain-containing protein n=1 Tax=Caenorhabditis elegans TaxID=6239 RepID=A0A8D6PJU0_CAEEL|nr:protein of unknown function WSN domain-containing protein [Caenorhabditis elegans]CAB04332.3 Domain of unknown function WSN domain-containing protein [Caenorhabditis elegans]